MCVISVRACAEIEICAIVEYRLGLFIKHLNKHIVHKLNTEIKNTNP